MPRGERRYFMALDDAYDYVQSLQSGQVAPTLYKVCSALRTLDKAIDSSQQGQPVSTPLSTDAWSAVRDKLFDLLITSFPGYFVVFEDGQDMPLPNGSSWPCEGRLEFYPEQGQRREDNYHAWLERIDSNIINSLRYCFAEGKQGIVPADFQQAQSFEESEDLPDLLEEISSQCRQEAQKGKKRAHQKWWQLYWEANSCLNKTQRHELRRQMDQLQSVWGKPS